MVERGRKPIVAEIERLRKERQWSPTELATRACCSERTIDSLRKGFSAYPCTYRKLAKAFGVSPTTLYVQEDLIGERAPFSVYRAIGDFGNRLFSKPDDRPNDDSLDFVEMYVKLGFPKDFKDFDETVDLVKIVTHLKGVLGEIKVLGVMQGSVWLVLVAPPPQLYSFLSAWYAGNFDSLHFAEVRCRPFPVPPLSLLRDIKDYLESREELFFFRITNNPDGSLTIARHMSTGDASEVQQDPIIR